MLTDMIEVEEFEIKEDEPWYDKQDLEHGKYYYIHNDDRDWESAGRPVLCVSVAGSNKPGSGHNLTQRKAKLFSSRR